MGSGVTPGTEGAPATDKSVIESLRGEVYLDELDQQLKDQQEKTKREAEDAEAKRKAEAEAKLRAEAQAAIPEDPRIKALAEALKISEEARARQVASLQPPPKVEEPAKEMSAEDLKKLYEENPLAAIDYMLEKRTKVIGESIDRRIGGLAASTASS